MKSTDIEKELIEAAELAHFVTGCSLKQNLSNRASIEIKRLKEELAQYKKELLMDVEPIHPTYGTLKELLAEIERDTRNGYAMRIGLHGALAWFSKQFARGTNNG